MTQKVKKYEKIIIEFLNGYAQFFSANVEKEENQVIIDSKNHHYLLLSLSWKERRFLHDTIFHFDIAEDGKVWIQANWTDVDITIELIEKGIKKSDIVLGFHHESVRQYTGFAVA